VAGRWAMASTVTRQERQNKPNARRSKYRTLSPQ
jgi:hypothetical protein